MNKTIEHMVPPYLLGLEPYVPGMPIEELERELRVRAVKLASNENPLGPSPLAMEAARAAMANAHRYPDGGGFYLRQKLAAKLGVEMEQVILGLGSSELIDLTSRVLLRPGDEGLTSDGSFPLYYISIRASGAKLVTVPLQNYASDLDAMARAITPHTKLIYLSNPNNPTGTFFTADALDEFLQRVPAGVMVVLDEAYFEYVEQMGYSRSLDLVRRGRNVIVLRTFSKIYGMAGMRIGYGLGPKELLDVMNKLRSPFNTTSPAQAAALAALDDVEHVKRSMETNRAGREQIIEALDRMRVDYVPGVANFLLIELGRDTADFAGEMMKYGVIVRPMRWMGFPNAIRVTIGTHSENERFLQALSAML